MTTRGKRLRRWLARPGTLILFVLLLGVFAQSYNGRKGLIDSQRHGCQRGVRKELLTIKDDNISIKKALAVAGDPTVPPSAAHANRVEAQEREAVREERYAFVAPENGGPLVCEKVYPDPSPLPW